MFMINRREFIALSLKSIVLIGAGSALQSFAPGSFVLPPRKKVKLRFALASDGHYGQPDTTFVEHHNNMVALLNKTSLSPQERALLLAAWKQAVPRGSLPLSQLVCMPA